MNTDVIIDYLSLYDCTCDDIKELTLNRFDVVGDINNIEIMDLLCLNNLEKLTLINLIIDDETLYVLSNLTKLTELSFINCETICDFSFFKNLKIRRLLIDNTNLEEYINDNSFEFLEIKNMKINCDKLNMLVLKVDKSDVDINTIVFNNIDTLIISNTQYNDNKALFANCNLHLIVKDDNYDDTVMEYEKV